MINGMTAAEEMVAKVVVAIIATKIATIAARKDRRTGETAGGAVKMMVAHIECDMESTLICQSCGDIDEHMALCLSSEQQPKRHHVQALQTR